MKLLVPGRWMFQLSSDTAIVTRKGTWVTMIVKISAGSRGARLDQRSLESRRGPTFLAAARLPDFFSSVSGIVAVISSLRGCGAGSP